MGELSRGDATRKRDEYVDKLVVIVNSIRENFEEMDFVNANQRDIMNNYIELMEAEYKELIEKLETMIFE